MTDLPNSVEDHQHNTTPLWEAEHPYYCAESNWYSNDDRIEQGTWSEWIEDAGHIDRDLNLVFRWDWHRADPDDTEPREYLEVFLMLQRKGRFVVWVFDVTEADEASVREWLEPSWRTMQAMWAPIAEGVTSHAV